MDNKFNYIVITVVILLILCSVSGTRPEHKENRPERSNVVRPNSALLWIPDATIKLDVNASKYIGKKKISDIDDIKTFLTRLVIGKNKDLADDEEFIGISLKSKKKGSIFYLKSEYTDNKKPTDKQIKELKDGLHITTPTNDNVGLYILPTQKIKDWLFVGKMDTNLLFFNLIISHRVGKNKTQNINV